MCKCGHRTGNNRHWRLGRAAQVGRVSYLMGTTYIIQLMDTLRAKTLVLGNICM